MITSSHNRLRASPYWCLDGDRWSEEMLVKLRDKYPDRVWDSTTEVEVTDVLETAGMAAALYTLGLPRPRYTIQADRILQSYVVELFSLLDAAVLTRVPPLGLSLRRAMLRYQDPQRRKEEHKHWAEVRAIVEGPDMVRVCDAALALVSELPVYVKAVHATKNLLEVEEYRNDYDKLCSVLKRIIETC